MDSSMRPWPGAVSACLLLALAGCAGETPERARIVSASARDTGAGLALEIEQQLRWSSTMLEALANGIPLRLVYRLDCPPWRGGHVIELRYAPLQRAYVMRAAGQPDRRFGRRSALLAAIDRVRLPLPEALPEGCSGAVRVALDLTSLPTPLRFPALLRPQDWRLVSPREPWTVDPD